MMCAKGNFLCSGPFFNKKKRRIKVKFCVGVKKKKIEYTERKFQ